jgi:hypothetical protein
VNESRDNVALHAHHHSLPARSRPRPYKIKASSRLIPLGHGQLRDVENCRPNPTPSCLKVGAVQTDQPPMKGSQMRGYIPAHSLPLALSLGINVRGKPPSGGSKQEAEPMRGCRPCCHRFAVNAAYIRRMNKSNKIIRILLGSLEWRSEFGYKVDATSQLCF